MAKDLLMTPEEFLKSGVHIGTRYKTGGMKKFIYSVRKDGLKVLAIETISDRIKEAAEMIAKYDPEKVVVVGRRLFASTPIKKFSEIIGAKPLIGRFIPGTFTNTSAKRFIEPDLVILTESNLDAQAVLECKKLVIPTIAFSSTNNFTEDINFIIPSNNKGRKSLAVLYWLLAREVQFIKGIIKSRSEFTHKVDDFEFKGKEKPTSHLNMGGKKGKKGGNARRGFNSSSFQDGGDRPSRPPFGSRGPGQGGFAGGQRPGGFSGGFRRRN